MKILVTGGSGYLGSHVRRYFSADDFSRRSNLDILNPRDTELVQDYDAVIQAGDMLIAIGSAESLAQLTALARGQAAAVPV